MKYENLILITLNNTLHIKADNLEPVEVDSSCAEYLYNIFFKEYDSLSYEQKFAIPFNEFKANFGVAIYELSDRIEVRVGIIDLGSMECEYGNGEYKAFLLPEKEEKQYVITQSKLTGVKINDVDYYTIEEIEKAIDEAESHNFELTKWNIINKLKK